MNHRLTLARALRDPALYSRTRIKNEDLNALGLATLRHNQLQSHGAAAAPEQHASNLGRQEAAPCGGLPQKPRERIRVRSPEPPGQYCSSPGGGFCNVVRSSSVTSPLGRSCTSMILKSTTS